MSGDALFRPKEIAPRSPVTDERHNGRIVNPPRWAHLGGLKSAGKAVTKNEINVRMPGSTVTSPQFKRSKGANKY
jgi:hypothetical protein